MLKVGDKVKIRDDLKSGAWINKGTWSINCEPEHLKHAGKSAVIIGESLNYRGAYNIDITDGRIFWCEEMFEAIEFVDKAEFERFMRGE